MKKILLIITLKILELSAIVFAPYGAGLIVAKTNFLGLTPPTMNYFTVWISGLISLLGIVVSIAFGLLLIFGMIPDWINLNKELAEKLLKRGEKP